jgi:hypothetical protein
MGLTGSVISERIRFGLEKKALRVLVGVFE